MQEKDFTIYGLKELFYFSIKILISHKNASSKINGPVNNLVGCFSGRYWKSDFEIVHFRVLKKTTN
jgi:hypothetical protein